MFLYLFQSDINCFCKEVRVQEIMYRWGRYALKLVHQYLLQKNTCSIFIFFNETSKFLELTFTNFAETPWFLTAVCTSEIYLFHTTWLNILPCSLPRFSCVPQGIAFQKKSASHTCSPFVIVTRSLNNSIALRVLNVVQADQKKVEVFC